MRLPPLRALLPVAGALLLAALVFLAGFALGHRAPAPRAEQPPVVRPSTTESRPLAQGNVIEFTGGRLVLSNEGGRSEWSAAADLRIEVLRPLAVTDLRSGQWANLGAIPNRLTTLAMTGLVAIEQEDVASR